MLHYISRVCLEDQDAARTCAPADARRCACDDNSFAIKALCHCRCHGSFQRFSIEERPKIGLRSDVWKLSALEKLENIPMNRWNKHVEVRSRSLFAADHPNQRCSQLEKCIKQSTLAVRSIQQKSHRSMISLVDQAVIAPSLSLIASRVVFDQTTIFLSSDVYVMYICIQSICDHFASLMTFHYSIRFIVLL